MVIKPDFPQWSQRASNCTDLDFSDADREELFAQLESRPTPPETVIIYRQEPKDIGLLYLIVCFLFGLWV